MKQVILVRSDLKMPKGKMAAQVAHASVEATLKSSKDLVKKWRQEGMKKIVLKVADLREMNLYKREADAMGITTAIIKDGAHTFFKRPTFTCLAIGPDKEEEIDEVTQDLKMM
jgi:peptidyl-tRNA hydrolase, PTH2 family